MSDGYWNSHTKPALLGLRAAVLSLVCVDVINNRNLKMTDSYWKSRTKVLLSGLVAAVPLWLGVNVTNGRTLLACDMADEITWHCFNEVFILCWKFIIYLHKNNTNVFTILSTNRHARIHLSTTNIGKVSLPVPVIHFPGYLHSQQVKNGIAIIVLMKWS